VFAGMKNWLSNNKLATDLVTTKFTIYFSKNYSRLQQKSQTCGKRLGKHYNISCVLWLQNVYAFVTKIANLYNIEKITEKFVYSRLDPTNMTLPATDLMHMLAGREATLQQPEMQPVLFLRRNVHAFYILRSSY
jgi:hypothetical protein